MADESAKCVSPDGEHDWSKERDTVNEAGEVVGTDYICSHCGMSVERFMALTH